MKEDIDKSRRERQRIHLGEKNGEWDRVWEEMSSDVRIGKELWSHLETGKKLFFKC